ncbi:acetyl-CoA acyltransferase [Antricoccus suffuscus]|uniref:Acetyl-CoA acyltransferase n=1 Tax=Antricoccus suffuscus TaxID=1629062 RepID=A0A2T1A2C8_9ACTN|nr:thiolase family protein [Antricoccus suffuscus]PRZ42759.1 acetyl-CoA acyltransferase [Antricoccus suffuscus]
MRDAVICAAIRTPVGKRNGGLSGVHAVDLSAQTLQALAERSGIDITQIEDVIWGCVSQVGEQTNDIARQSVLAAGWPESITGVTVDRQCGSSQQALVFAASSVIAGYNDVVVAGGVESMSRVPMGSSKGVDVGTPNSPLFMDRYKVAPNQGIGAEMIAEQQGFSRTQLDEFAIRSHEKAAKAQDSGAFESQLFPVETPDGIVKADEGVRRGSTVEKLGTLPTPFKADGVISAGNASQISDGSSAMLVTTSEKAKELGLTPLVRVHSTALAGSNPIIMLDAPVPATEKVIARSGLKIEDIDIFEVNEAFASVPLLWLKKLGVSEDKMNVNGGAIALGHPLGGSGGRLMATLIHAMIDGGAKYGLQTMCEGGGQANATILERL